MLMQSPPGPETVIDGVRYLYFGGTSYLGLASHADVIEAACRALRQYGVHSATTRSRFGTQPPIAAVERGAAEFFGTEASFYFASGYVANHILVLAFARDVDAIIVDDAAHYSVTEAAALSVKPIVLFRHRDIEDLEDKIACWSRVLVMADGVAPVSGILAPVADYIDALAARPGSILMLDDAHGVGVLGRSGRGTFDDAGVGSHVNGGPALQGIRLVMGATCSKALGGYGGIIAGSDGFVDRVRRASHHFDGASAPAAPVAGATAKALELARVPALRQRLTDNREQLASGLRQLGIEVPAGGAAHFGIVKGDAGNMQRIHESLLARGILLPYVDRYSGTPEHGVLRFAVFANHSSEQIDRLLTEFRSVL